VSKIFKDTHKIIAKNIHKNIYDIYGIELDEKKLLWGSISPDILPKYKLHRHYKKESLDYVVNEIVKLIFICRLSDYDANSVKGKSDAINLQTLIQSPSFTNSNCLIVTILRC